MKDEYKTDHRLEMLEFVNKLNANYISGSFSIDKDGDLNVTTQLTFTGQLTYADLDLGLACMLDVLISGVIPENKGDFDRYMN